MGAADTALVSGDPSGPEGLTGRHGDGVEEGAAGLGKEREGRATVVGERAQPGVATGRVIGALRESAGGVAEVEPLGGLGPADPAARRRGRAEDRAERREV